MSDETEVLSRRQREKLRHREEVLSVAIRLFSAKGFHNVSMQEIASEAEFAIGTLYNLFASKETLFDELVEVSGKRMVANVVAILDLPGTEVERLANYFRSLPAQLEEHAPFMKLYVSEAGMRGAKLAKNRSPSSVKTVLTSRIRNLIESGVRNGVFRPVDPEIAAIAINSTLETLAFEMAERFDRAKATQVFEKLEHFFLDGLLKPEEPAR